MPIYAEIVELKDGLILFRRGDVKHNNWYCRIKVPTVGVDRYKTYPLNTPAIGEATTKAYEHDADIRFRDMHSVPIFGKSFEKLATEYSAHLKAKVDVGDMQERRWKTIDSLLQRYLIPYVGPKQIAQVTPDIWRGYRPWRKRTAKEEHEALLKKGEKGLRDGGNPKDATIRDELTTFRNVMEFGVTKGEVTESQIARDQIVGKRTAREEFRPDEYRHLHQFARDKWIPAAEQKIDGWYRQIAYYCMLCMTNTGMRATEAKNLRWRDLGKAKKDDGTPVTHIHVHGKGKFRVLVADIRVADYFERIRKISRATKPEDFIFSGYDGGRARHFYAEYFNDLINKAGLLVGPRGTRRCATSFRHTYATFRLTHGTNIHNLARQMGTSVKMLEQHYSHVLAINVADNILVGVPGRGTDEDVDSLIEGERVALDDDSKPQLKNTTPKKKSARRPPPRPRPTR